MTQLNIIKETKYETQLNHATQPPFALSTVEIFWDHSLRQKSLCRNC
jgi:hypothetical protein